MQLVLFFELDFRGLTLLAPVTASSPFTGSGATMYNLDSSLFHGSTRGITTHFLRSIKSQRQFHQQGMFDKLHALNWLLAHFRLRRSLVDGKAQASSHEMRLMVCLAMDSRGLRLHLTGEGHFGGGDS